MMIFLAGPNLYEGFHPVVLEAVAPKTAASRSGVSVRANLLRITHKGRASYLLYGSDARGFTPRFTRDFTLQRQLDRFVDNADEPAAHAVDLTARDPRRFDGQIGWRVVVTAQIGEGRPPFFGPDCLRITAHCAGQLNPHRLLA